MIMRNTNNIKVNKVNKSIGHTMKNTLLIMFTILISLLILTACNTNPRKEAEDLNSKAYGKLIRWKAYDDASSYIKLRDGGNVVVDSDLLNEIRVTKYEVTSIIMNDERDEAVIVAEIAYYHERVNSVREIKNQQIWWKEESTGAWYLDGQLPPFIR